MSWIYACLAGFVTGILSGFGVGGGTLLMIYMTAFAGIAQATAQGINLLYFLPTSASSLVSHFKNRLIDRGAAIPAILAGAASTAGAAALAIVLDVSVMKRAFGVFLLVVGVVELLGKKESGKEKVDKPGHGEREDRKEGFGFKK